MQNSHITRREFSKLTATAIAAGVPAINVPGANEKIHLGFIGLGGRGSHHLSQFVQFDDVEIVSLCDPYKPHIERNAERVGHKVQMTQDFRQVLDNPDVDAVVIASPDHWHAIQTILACQAGKDVYVEKPLSRTIEEGRRLIEAVDKTKRIVRSGSSNAVQTVQKAVEMVKNGEVAWSPPRAVSTSAHFWLSQQGPEGIGKPEDGFRKGWTMTYGWDRHPNALSSQSFR